MAYDEDLAARVRRVLSVRSDIEEKRMFGGLTFMLGGNMCCGVAGDDLVLRVGTERAKQAVKKQHVRFCDFTGKPMTTMITVAPDGYRSSKSLKGWIGLAVEHAAALPRKPAKRPHRG